MEIDIETIKTLCKHHWELGYRDRNLPRNFLQLSATQAAKIKHEFEGSLQTEYDWLKYLTPLIDYKLVVLPKPHGELITHDELQILVMDYIGGVEVEDLITNGKKLSDDDANRICDAYLAIRAIKPQPNKLCPSESWLFQGHIFKPFGEGNLVKSSITELSAYMDDRLTGAYDGNKTTFPMGEIAWNHGDLSPNNIKLLDDGRVAFYDLERSLWGPSDWDLIALPASPYDDNSFVQPLKEAFHRRGLTLSEERQDMYNKFMRWHARVGAAAARDQVKRERERALLADSQPDSAGSR